MNTEIRNDLINIANALGNDWKVDQINLFENNGYIFNNKMKGVKIFFIRDFKNEKRIQARLIIGSNNFLYRAIYSCTFDRTRNPQAIVKDIHKKIINFIPEEFEKYQKSENIKKEETEEKEIIKTFLSSLMDYVETGYNRHFLSGKKNNVNINLERYKDKKFSLELHNLTDEQITKILKLI